VIFNKHVFLALVVIIYAAAFIATFDELYDSVEISSIALVGLCGWFYGYRIGFFSVIFFVLLNTAILYFVSGKLYDILLTYNPVGIIMAMLLAICMGLLKESCDKLSYLRSSLESRIDESTAKLDELARQLIENDERERIQIGQDIHDGVGQYLTSMLLRCEALSLSLRKDKRVEADLAEWMTQRVQKNIVTVRRLSRSLLPIKFTETNLETALGEMTAYFNEVSTAHITLTYPESSMVIPLPAAQQLYRVTHETIYLAIYKLKATAVDIRLATDQHNCRIRIKGSGTQSILHPSDLVSGVMKYRIRTIGGKLALTALTGNGFQLDCSADFKEEAG
jgi:signal transduction histidine kinase